MCFCRDLVILQERIVKNVSARLFGDKQVITGRCCQGAQLVPLCGRDNVPLLRCVVFVGPPASSVGPVAGPSETSALCWEV